MNNKFDALKDDDSGDHDQNEENNTQKDGEKEKNDREKPQTTTKRKAVVPGPAEHPLQYNYTFWYSRRTPGRPTSSQSYEQNIKQIGTFASVEQFWRFYSHMVRPGDLTGHSDFHLFKEGIKPMWEDDANKNGGKWIIRLRKGLASRCWENLILAMLGEQFMVGEEICGAVVSVRFQGLGGVSWPGEQQWPLIERSPSLCHTQGIIQAFETQKSHCENKSWH
ncbi:eukaryotic translation initiation factor 4E type 2 isoform X4 [Dryobates pubescens]|uniref:eukaryotic translation initiation factor 4E type 2 isoform X4 n=1 Tax=Dryobates pubescens TaxID=118200 RepID=UPI0023B8A350|nr:eukaryotic translation initiation factor 4E type 2 isoform X4 [Dryobates pubescens]